MMRNFFMTILTALLVFSSPARAQTDAERQQFQTIINSQVEAFRQDDGMAAYAFAAPIIKRMFPTAENFLAMVKQGYPQVYRAKSLRFGDVFTDNFGRMVQRVALQGPDGKRYEALYAMEKQADGQWKIAGCTIIEIPGLDA